MMKKDVSEMIAVAIDKSKRSMDVLKWAVENVVSSESSLHLIHTYKPIENVPTPGGIRPIGKVSHETAAKFREQQQIDIRVFMKKFEKYCENKKIKAIIHLVENKSEKKALVDQIIKLGISKLIMGHTSSNKVTLAISGPAKSDYVANHAPDSCAVMVIKKGSVILKKYSNKCLISPESPLSPPPNSVSPETTCYNNTPGAENTIGGNSSNCSDYTPTSSSRYSFDSTASSINFLTTSGILEIKNDPVSSDKKIDGPSDNFIRNYPQVYSDSNPLSGRNTDQESSGLILREATESTSYLPDALQKGDESLSRQKEEDGMIPAASEKETDATMTEVEKLSARLQLAEEALLKAESMREEETHMKEVTLNKLDLAKKKYNEERTKLGDMATMVLEARRDVETYKKFAVQEKQRCEEAVSALEESKREAEMAKQKIAEILMELQKTENTLEREIRLREEAEEKVYQEALSKQRIACALRKAQMKYCVYSFENLMAATNNFSEEQKLGEDQYGCIYKGEIHGTYITIKVLRQDVLKGHSEFQNKVELLGKIQHPKLAMPIGACPENAGIIYQYMANGSLQEFLSNKPLSNPLPWYVRIQICYDVALGLFFLHNSQLELPIIQCNLNPKNILLDHNFVPKISGVGLSWLIAKEMACFDSKTGWDVDVYTDPEYMRSGKFGSLSNVYSLGIVILQMLTGNPEGVGVMDLVDDALEDKKLCTVLDSYAGDWPVEEATKLARLGLHCAEPRWRRRIALHQVLSALKDILTVSDYESLSGQGKFIPAKYMCPISQEVMVDPYTAADEFTYEYQNIKEWLSNHDTSPITNLAFPHKNITPNYSLQSTIREWQLRRQTLSKPAVNVEMQ